MKPKRSKEWRLAKELYEAAAAIRLSEITWETLIMNSSNNKAWLREARFVLTNFTRKKRAL